MVARRDQATRARDWFTVREQLATRRMVQHLLQHLRELLNASDTTCKGPPLSHHQAPSACSCKLMAADTDAAASVEAMLPWGQPNPQCPAGSKLQAFAAAHEHRKRNGRILLHCETASGLGNYLRSVPVAALLAMVLELALVLECDEVLPDHDGGHAAGLSHLLSTYFRGPLFDWRAPAQTHPQHPTLGHASLAELGKTPTVLMLRRAPVRVLDMRRKESLERWDVRNWSNTQGGVRLLTSGSTNLGAILHRLLSRPDNLAAAHSRLGVTIGSVRALKLATKVTSSAMSTASSALAGCLLFAVLAPTPHLVALLARVPNSPRVGGGGSAGRERSGTMRLHQSVGAHVRTGDAAFTRDATKLRWRFSSVHHMSAFHHSPVGAMRCLQQASSDGLEHRGTTRGCLGCFLASDSPVAIRCARRLLAAPTLTDGEAVHLGVAPAALTRRAGSVDKIFLDWWLLARSRVLINFQAELLREPRNASENPMAHPSKWTLGRAHTSSFVETALMFRDASSPHGRTIKLSPRAPLDSQRALLAQCGIDRRPTHPQGGHQGSHQGGRVPLRSVGRKRSQATGV